MNTRDILAELEALDWHAEDVMRVAQRPVMMLASSSLALSELVAGALADPRLIEMSERDLVLTKFVLYCSPSGRYRIRIHLFEKHHVDRPHTHRWPFVATVLRGSYLHTLFTIGEMTSPARIHDTLSSVFVRRERPGFPYYLAPAAVHSLDADAGTVSLVVRGPASVERMLVLEPRTRAAWWYYGKGHPKEGPEQWSDGPPRSDLEHRPVGREHLLAVVRRLATWGVVRDRSWT